MKHSLSDLFHQCAGLGWEKQRRLVDLVGDAPWLFDKNQGTLRFGDLCTLPVQILGTESEGTGTWLWGWANAASGIPGSLLASAERLKSVGEAQGLSALTTPHFPIAPDLNGHVLSLIGTVLAKADGYYRCAYPQGAMYVLVFKLPLPPLGERVDPTTIVTVFLELMGQYSLDHYKAFLAYLEQHGLTYSPSGKGIIVRFPGGGMLEADFDENARLVNFRSVNKRDRA
jgi:hypothetical protein